MELVLESDAVLRFKAGLCNFTLDIQLHLPGFILPGQEEPRNIPCTA